MKKRIIAGLLVATGWLSALYFMPGWFLVVVLAAVFALCHYEFYSMMAKAGFELSRWYGLAVGLIWISMTYILPVDLLNSHPEMSYITGCTLTLLVIFGFMIRALFDPRLTNPVNYVALSLLSFFYIPFMLSYFVRIAQWGAHNVCTLSAPSVGIYMAFFIALVVKMGDVGAYGFGMTLGKHKMFPRISPNKSWEGLLGGFLVSILACYLGIAIARHWSIGGPLALLNGQHAIALGILLNSVGVLGDLVESMFKRVAKIKDSAGLLPGLGGILDMFDSLMFAPPVLYYYLKIVIGPVAS